VSEQTSPQAPGAALVDKLVRIIVGLFTLIIFPLATFIASQEIASRKALESRVVTLEREGADFRRQGAVRDVLMDGFRADLERVPSLEQIRAVIREEIDRGRPGSGP
jgi:hypothetical protein